MALQRTHILLEPEQQRRLSEIAHDEGRSVSEVAREMIQRGIMNKDLEKIRMREKRQAALAAAAQLRGEIAIKYGELDVDIARLIADMREERDADILGSRD